MPKLVDLDDGRATYDESFWGKRPDWTYSPEGGAGRGESRGQVAATKTPFLLALELPTLYNRDVLTKEGGRSPSHRSVVRGGAATIALGVGLDIPPHLLPHAPLELMALVGHLVVLAGMLVVLTGLALAAAPRTNARRHS